MTESIDQPSTSSSKRRVPHVSRACLVCRRRKVRCDGLQPTCKACDSISEACEWPAEADKRKLGARIRSKQASLKRTLLDIDDRADVHELKLRNARLRSQILALEKALASRGISVSEALSENSPLPSTSSAPKGETHSHGLSTLALSAASGDELDQDRNSSTGSDEEEVEHLQLDDKTSSTLSHFGPASALFHLNHATSGDPSLHSPMFLNRTTPATNQPQTDPLASMFPWLQPQQELDWSHHLPDLGITKDTHDALLELCEAFFTPWCLVVDFPAFRRDMQRCLCVGTEPAAPVRTPYYSPLLHNMVLAQGASLWQGDRLKRSIPDTRYRMATPPADLSINFVDFASESFAARARDFFNVECERPMQSTINGLLLMASHHSGKARPNLGHVFFTCALATSHSLGINIDCTKFVQRGVISKETQKERNQLFWTVYIQDKLWSMAVGRFANLTAEDEFNIKLPEVDPAQDAVPWRAPRVWQDLDDHNLCLADGRPGYVASCHCSTVQLGVLITAIMRKCYSLKTSIGADAVESTESILQRLKDWYQNLPPPIKSLEQSSVPPPHVLTLHITYNYAVMLLLRPIWQRSGNKRCKSMAVSECHQASIRTVELLGIYDRFYGLGHAPLSSIQTTFVAGTVHLLAALESSKQSNSGGLQSALHGIAICIAALDCQGQSWKSASRTSRILRSLVEQWLPGSVVYMEQHGWLSAPAAYNSRYLGQHTSSTVDAAVMPLPKVAYPTAFETGSLEQRGTAAALDQPTTAYQLSPDSVNASVNSIQFLNQLLQQQQFENFQSGVGHFNHQETPNFLGAQPWQTDIDAGDPLLSSFDFSVEAFDEMLRATEYSTSL